MNKKTLYRVKFQEKDDDKPITVVVRYFSPSDFLGLVTLEDFVFEKEAKLVLMPGEDETRKRFESTHKLHLPYHALLSVEEFYEDDKGVSAIPFIREVPKTPDISEHLDS